MGFRRDFLLNIGEKSILSGSGKKKYTFEMYKCIFRRGGLHAQCAFLGVRLSLCWFWEGVMFQGTSTHARHRSVSNQVFDQGGQGAYAVNIAITRICNY